MFLLCTLGRLHWRHFLLNLGWKEIFPSVLCWPVLETSPACTRPHPPLVHLIVPTAVMDTAQSRHVGHVLWWAMAAPRLCWLRRCFAQLSRVRREVALQTPTSKDRHQALAPWGASSAGFRSPWDWVLYGNVLGLLVPSPSTWAQHDIEKPSGF